MSTAKISIWDRTVGYITWDDQHGTAIFESDEDYFDLAWNISPIIHPEKSELLFGNNFHDKFKGMIPTFNDSLPDSFGNVVFKEWLEHVEIDQSDMNPVERLLYVGQRGIGALEYHVSKEIPAIAHNLNLEELSLISDKIIKRKYQQEDYLHNPEALKSILNIGSSVGGAQAKILVAITKESKPENEKILAGDIIHPMPVDYYIVKLEHDSKDLWQKEKNYVEYVYNQIAKDAGLNVAHSKLIREGGRAHFASKRFDRIANRKVHKQTVSAFAGFYGKNTEFSYEHIFKIIEFLKLPYEDRMHLYRQMVFNVLAANRDDHTKNFSFLMDETGKWSLSPAYDLTFPFDPYQSFVIPHQISINQKVKQINRRDLQVVAEKVGIMRYNELIENVIDNLQSFSKRVEEYDISKKTTGLIMAEIEENINRVKA